METMTVRGYKVEYDIDPERARKAVEFFLDFDMRCTDGKRAIATISNVRIRFMYEGTAREYIEVKNLNNNPKENTNLKKDELWKKHHC